MQTAHTFRLPYKIHFSRCDPAGIIFYPQYFILFNDLVESWIDAILPGGYHGLVGERRVGMPTVHLESDFRAISRFGEQVWLELEVTRLGNRSITLSWRCVGTDDVVRMSAVQTLVTTSLDTHKSIALPDDLRTAIE